MVELHVETDEPLKGKSLFMPSNTQTNTHSAQMGSNTLSTLGRREGSKGRVNHNGMNNISQLRFTYTATEEE